MAQEISIERPGGGVAVLSLNAPERRNALTVGMAEELHAACEELDADREVGAVVVRGEGGFFCAGGDRATLEAAGRDPADPELFAGAGLNLMPATDLRVVARDVRIVSGFIPIRLHQGGGHGALLGRIGGSLRTVLGPPAIPWPAALELERASQMWWMRRKAQRG